MQPQASYQGTIVILDDEEGMCRALTKLLTVEGYHVTAFSRADEAIEYLEGNAADILLSDMKMPAMSGRDVLGRVRSMEVPVEVILMTGYGSIEEAIECVKGGAYDYITKPLNHSDLLATLRRAIERRRLNQMNQALSRAYSASPRENTLIGNSPAMVAVREMIERVAPADTPVLITGESGTGKELAARAIHRLSPRSRGRFVAINCASIPENLLESELFGHERGAFTGADETKIGLVEVADGGTLFLDEIGELPMPMQAKLLRVLQEREITRVGGLGAIKVDIRIVAATNRRLEERIAEGSFRDDLYYRLNVITIRMPPLRKRREDIAVLAESFLREIADKNKRGPVRFSEDAIAILVSREYPGNIRELRNIVERCVILSSGDLIDADAVAMPIMPAGETTPTPTGSGVMRDLARYANALASRKGDYRSVRDSFEREFLSALLRKHHGSVTEAAKASGLSRRTLYEKIEKLGVPHAEGREAE